MAKQPPLPTYELPLSAFIVPPRRSLAVPIINPESGTVVPTPASGNSNKSATGVQTVAPNTAIDVNTSARSSAKVNNVVNCGLPVSLGPGQEPEPPVSQPWIASDGTPTPTPSARTDTHNVKKVGGKHDAKFDRGFDVYASPFVPEIFRIVNQSDGVVLPTQPTRELQFGAHAAAYLGCELLPPIPPPGEPTPAGPSPSTTPLGITPALYESHFRGYLDHEIRCQQKENASYALYMHRGVVDPVQPGICRITVPGLREYSPYVEEDDVVELRLLQYDRFGRLCGSRDAERGPGIPRFPWNWKILLSRVHAVLRAREELVLRIDGLGRENFGVHPLSNPGDPGASEKYELDFNIQFPVPQERYAPMYQALAHVQKALDEASSNTYLQVDRKATKVTQEFHYWFQSMMFPTEADCDAQANPQENFREVWFDGALNEEQQTAVQNVCLQNYGTVPYIISGPPGTGKTKTIIEIALQLLSNVDQISHILICAPSEPATDTLADRLRKYLQPQDMLRLNRSSRSFTEIADELLPYCYISDQMFNLPPFEQLMKYRIVVTSCRDASMLMYSRVTNADLYHAEYGLRSHIHPFSPGPSEVKLHWTACLLDEAAQALEPEALLPLVVVAPPLRSPKLNFTPLFVMAGDERQLGPRTSAPTTPLKSSLFARLFARPVYANHPLARGKTGEAPPPLTSSMLPILRPAFTNLIRNYRSHADILTIPSQLFYFNTLQACATNTDKLAEWPGWSGRTSNGRRFPVLFHDNNSPDDLERDGGGWYNVGEADIALKYAASLVTFLDGRQQEVCIMSPFKSQVGLLRKKARSAAYNLRDVNIGPTEAFQGLEHGVVILCITRSRKRFVDKDRGLNWGIIGTPNKMNVALTRAKYGLIIVGSEDVLVDDPHWKVMLEFCRGNGAVVSDERDRGEGSEGSGSSAGVEDDIDNALFGNGRGGAPVWEILGGA